MILENFSFNRAKKLTKTIIPTIKEPIDIKILWLQYNDFNSLSAYFNNKLHKHAFYELHFILEGSDIITDRNENERLVYAGEGIIIPPNSSHTFINKNENLKRFSIAFILPEEIDKNNLFATWTPFTLHDDIIDRLNTIFLEADKNTALSLYITKNRIYEILYNILTTDSKKHQNKVLISDTNNNNFYIDKAKSYVKDNLNTNLNCKDVAEYCNITTTHLNRLFQKYTKESVRQYIQRKKIEYCIELFKNKDLPLSTISQMLGFQNEYYFNAYFKKATGSPPPELTVTTLNRGEKFTSILLYIILSNHRLLKICFLCYNKIAPQKERKKAQNVEISQQRI